jgi:membrane protease YdiL (CAAX protease family)
VLVILASAPVLLSLWRTLGSAADFPRLFGEGAAVKADGLAPWLWQFGSFAFLCLVLPFVHARARRLASVSVLGWRIPRPRVWFWTLLAVGAAVGAGAHSASMPDMKAEYPMFRGLLARHDLALPYEAAYVLLYYVAWESYFRGYLLFGLERSLGAAEAVLVQTTSSCLVHIGKPPAELLASIPFGVVLGIVALRTRSFWPGLLVHAALGVSLDLFVVGAS